MAPRRSLDETRSLLLDTGARMLIDEGVKVSLGALNMMDVCREAGLKTAGSAYKIWDSQEAFRVELLRHLVDSTAETDEMIAAIIDIVSGDGGLPSFTELIRVFAATDFESNDTPESLQLYLALWVAARHDPVLARSLASSDKALLERRADVYETVAEAYDREFIPPYDASTLATLLAALIEGLLIRNAVDPQCVATDLERPTGPDGSMQRWHLYACGADAIINACTRPRGSDGSGSDGV